MRNLTITREKSSFAGLSKMKVYIQDPSSTEIKINGVPCRLLGKIKNGEQKVFQIDDNEALVFVIAGKMSKWYCCDCAVVPAGEFDVFLRGKNQFDPTTGNAFRFNGVPHPIAAAHRQKTSTAGVVLLVMSVIIATMVGFFIGRTLAIFKNRISNDPMVFYGDGFEITLTEEFWLNEDMEGFTACYDSRNVAVFVREEEFSLLDGFANKTLREYAELILENNGFNYEIKTNGDLMYFEYTYFDEASGESYHYTNFVYKGDDAFWFLQFAFNEKSSDKYSEKVFEWAASVDVGGNSAQSQIAA